MVIREIDHTHPHTDEPFVEPFRRGHQVAADGGERNVGVEDDVGNEDDVGVEDDAGEEEDPETETMADVTHDSPNEGTNRTFERGREGRDESV